MAERQFPSDLNMVSRVDSLAKQMSKFLQITAGLVVVALENANPLDPVLANKRWERKLKKDHENFMNANVFNEKEIIGTNGARWRLITNLGPRSSCIRQNCHLSHSKQKPIALCLTKY